ncbi:beta-ketoacyl-ACP synthase II [Candidatus Calescamantes bacterium]|nr:beta-ketoacyl-ACP synthase II [Candidatus Calescamantes bacterium]
MKGKRVVVTGIGVVTPLGHNIEEFFSALLEGKSGIGKLTLFDPSPYPSQIAAEVKNLPLEKYLTPKEIKRMDRFTHFAIYAAEEALRDAGLENEGDKDSWGVILGSGIGGLWTIEEQHTILKEKGASRVSPFLIPMLITDIAPGHISIRHGLRGPNFSVSTACASSAHAIGLSFRLIQQGEAEVIIAGGSEAAITPLGLAGFCNMKALSTRNDSPEEASRPFDRERDGFVMGEGAGILILEELGRAKKRGAKIYAEIIGFGLTSDAYHVTAPDPEGIGQALAMKRALEDAEISPEMVDYINAHGTSTPLNDKVETLAIKKVFGEKAKKIAISSTKSMIGHTLGAAGAIEAAVCCMSIVKGVVHPTINYKNPDPECDLDYVPNQPKEMEVKIVLSNSFGFGGHNATLIFKKFEG